jgi:hypothetical protein
MSTQPRVESRAALNQRAAQASMPLAIAVLIAGWLVPGAGHLIQKRWGRGTLLFLAITGMFVLGLLMDGKIYQWNTGDILDMLGFVGDVGAGLLYMVARAMDLGRGAIMTATQDYGKIFIIVSGLLNIVAAVDAHNIALGKKQ